ncbi:hypothetical protein GCM10012284_19040 [Mangrovihabitans endophyticus]|uniref:Uncharacterized protein n=1 Tax=Mangrovihabitans endophyticus TaxID=1751298 RepID=A0A8J3BWL1_9ACTN|nr:hypothetical protein GCM10012284_19040 [Mangrovihabitans endophyticus]
MSSGDDAERRRTGQGRRRVKPSEPAFGFMPDNIPPLARTAPMVPGNRRMWCPMTDQPAVSDESGQSPPTGGRGAADTRRRARHLPGPPRRTPPSG